MRQQIGKIFLQDNNECELKIICIIYVVFIDANNKQLRK